MKRGMIDIETLSSFPDAAVLSIGLVGFDENDILFKSGVAIKVADWHGHVDPRTIQWWMQQSKEAQDYSFNHTSPWTAKDAATQLVGFADEYCQQECWANGPQFDLVVLRKWWNRTTGNDKFPIHYRNYRDCRTLWKLAESNGLDLAPHFHSVKGAAHDPMVDAERQAKVVQAAIKHLKRGTAV